MSRPSGYSQKVAESICQRLADGESLRSICKDSGMPAQSSVFRWLADEGNASFREQYARAREAQAEKMAEEILEIADNPFYGLETTTKPNGDKEVKEGDMIAHRRLQVDARKWLASKLYPKKYGDKQQTEITGAEGKDLFEAVVASSDKLRESLRGS